MIDMHVHVVAPNLPGAGSLGPLLDASVDQVADALARQMAEADIDIALGMGALLGSPDDPLGIAGTLAIARRVPGLYAIGAMDPRLGGDADHLRGVQRQMRSGQVKALKGYLGYLHYGPDSPGYRPYYELAAQYRLPVIFHTGDTYSPRAKLRFAHPLLVDEVAVDHPDVRFVLAHVGNPWMLDAAEVVYKNINVWADISGLAIGSEEDFAHPQSQEMRDETLVALRKAFRYAERPNRFLHGSDWPLAPLGVYQRWVANAIPEIHHQQVFEDNARLLFGL